MIQEATTDEEIASTFSAMRQLRLHLTEDEYLETIKRMQRSGYRLAAVTESGETRCVAGFRGVESLAYGKFLYVDDLVTAEYARSGRHGKRMLDWLAKRVADSFSLTQAYRGTTRTGSTSEKE